MTNPCTCKAEHWQPHADSCPLAKPLPRIPPKHLKDGCYARADALEAHLNAAKAEVERLQCESDAWDKLSLVQLSQENQLLKRDRDTLLEMTGTTIEQVARRIEKLPGTSAEPVSAQGLKSIGFEPRGSQIALVMCFDSIENAQAARARASDWIVRAAETSPAEPRSYCPNCDCDYCGSVQGRLQRDAVKSDDSRGFAYQIGDGHHCTADPMNLSRCMKCGSAMPSQRTGVAHET